AQDYSDVVVLCYTRSDETDRQSLETQGAFNVALASIHDSNQQKDWKSTSDFVSRFANTAAAHEHFVRWLNGKFHTGGSSPKISYKTEKLRELNDSEGIYAC